MDRPDQEAATRDPVPHHVVDDLLRAVREIDAEMRRMDRHSPDYQRLGHELERTARAVFHGAGAAGDDDQVDDGPGTARWRAEDRVRAAVEAVEREDSAA